MDRPSDRGRNDLTAAEPDRGRRPDWLAAFGVTAVSLVTPLHFDEAFWVSIARMVGYDGRTLYVTAIDNKTPIVYAFSGLLDVLPGPLFIARAAAIGLLAMLLSRALRRLEVVWFTRVVAVLVATFATGLVLSTELPALVLLAWSLVAVEERRAWKTVEFVAFAALFDPRAVVIGVVVLVFLARRVGSAHARLPTATLILAGLGAVATVIASSTLRYGLIELNLASRAALGGPNIGEVLIAASVVLLPLAMLGPVFGGFTAKSWALAGASVVVAIASINPFSHYWAYSVLAVAFFGTEPSYRQKALALAALIPLVATFTVEGVTQAEVIDSYREAAGGLAQVVGEDETFVQFALVPYPYFFSGEKIGLDAPGIHYLTWDTSRRTEQLEKLADSVQRAAAIVDDGGLRSPPGALPPELESVRNRFHPSLAAFPCVEGHDGVAVLHAEPCDR